MRGDSRMVHLSRLWKRILCLISPDLGRIKFVTFKKTIRLVARFIFGSWEPQTITIVSRYNDSVMIDTLRDNHLTIYHNLSH